jgi:AcrR family transcriptional regulator
MSSEQRETRTRILAATWQLLEEKSGKEVRMQDIARAAGISRQAVYFHFKSRSELLVATTHYVDEIRDVDGRIRRWEAATTGVERLEEWVEMWGNYIPEIFGVGKALLAVRETDEAADLAWKDRMSAVRSKCVDTVEALERDGMLVSELTRVEAVDLLSTILSVRSWEHLTKECGWSNGQVVRLMKQVLRRTLVRNDGKA